MSTKNMANREVCDLIFVDYENKVPFLNLDFANVSTTELTGESTFAYGGKGYPKRVRFAGEKSGTLTIETQIQTVKLWQLITGGEKKTSAEFVTRVVAAADETGKVITLKDTPAENSVYVYAQDDDCGTKLDCTVSGAAVTLDTALDAGKSHRLLHEIRCRRRRKNQRQIYEHAEKLYRLRRYGHADGRRQTASVPDGCRKMRAAEQFKLIVLQQRRPGYGHDHLRSVSRRGQQHLRSYFDRRGAHRSSGRK